jgi:hypothetical protein
MTNKLTAIAISKATSEERLREIVAILYNLAQVPDPQISWDGAAAHFHETHPTLAAGLSLAAARFFRLAKVGFPAIKTEFVYPPIPPRDFDWSAVTDNYEPGHAIGRGRTEGAAIEDLLSQLEDWSAA